MLLFKSNAPRIRKKASRHDTKHMTAAADRYKQLPADDQQACGPRMVTMCEYVLNFEMNLYGPYYSEPQARFAQALFAKKYPKLAKNCSLLQINLDSERVKLIDPHLLH
ncbi:MAG: hypothetical protein R8K50_02035 [Mariprofundus sp.]